MDDYLKLLVELHRDGERQGPGSEAATQRMLQLAGLAGQQALKIADIGCGTGASSLQLARQLDADITAVDLLPEFLEVLERNARSAGVSEQISTLECSMEELPFAEEEYDVIWSEGAIYNMGFAKGVGNWRPFLKPGGLLIVTEITWLTEERPEEIQQYWNAAYPEIDTAAAKIRVLEETAYSPIAYFSLAQDCWLDNYYRPMQARLAGFLEKNRHSDAARALVGEEEKEIALYEKYREYYSYGVYIAEKLK